MKEKQLKHDLDEQVRYPVPVHLLSTNKTVCFRRQQQKPASRRYNRAGHIWTQIFLKLLLQKASASRRYNSFKKIQQSRAYMDADVAVRRL